MLDPSLCASKTTTGNWAAASWWIFSILINPTLVLPFILSVIGLPWLVKPLWWKRQISQFGVLLLLFYLLILSPTVIAIGNRLLVTFLPNDSGMIADAIVVLGRGTDLRPDRVQVAARLWQAGRAPLVFASGRGDAVEINQMLEAQGLPKQAIDGEPCSRTTEENARFTAALLKPRNIQRILLVTDPPHMLRSLLTFSSLGFQVIPHSNPLPVNLDQKEKAFLLFREYLGIVGYGLQGRFLPRDVPSVNTIGQRLPSLEPSSEAS